MLERNYGCRIHRNLLYKGVALLIMENEKLRISILVGKGTDIIEFLYKPKDIDFMWRGPVGLPDIPHFVTTDANRLGNFMDYYIGAWQEILPNGGAPCRYKGTTFGLHGEVSLIPWEYAILEDNPQEIAVKFWVRTYRTPFYLEKILKMKGNDPSLYIEESLHNEAEEEMDLMWGHHPAFGEPFISSDCTIELPPCKIKVTKGDGLSNSRLKEGEEGDWPYAPGKEGGKVDLRRIPGPEEKTSEMIFLSELNEGWYRIRNEKLKLSFRLNWSLETFPFLWYWQVCKGSFNYPWYGRTYNIALEPFSSLPNLEQAIKSGTQIKLNPHEEIKTNLSAIVEEG